MPLLAVILSLLPIRTPGIRRLTTTAPRAMPWLMKAEPDSRIVKGKDVKVGRLLIG